MVRPQKWIIPVMSTRVRRTQDKTWNRGILLHVNLKYVVNTDHEADLEVCEEDERDDEDADHGKREVPPKLEYDDLVGFPCRVNLEDGKYESANE